MLGICCALLIIRLINELVYREEEKSEVTGTTKHESEEEDAGTQSPIETVEVGLSNSHTPRCYSRSLSHISESSADGVVLTDRSTGESGEVMSLTSGISINDIEMEMPSRTPEPTDSVATDTDMSPRKLGDAEENATAVDDTDNDGQHPIEEEQDTLVTVIGSTTASADGVDSNTSSEVNTQPELECSTLEESGDVTYVAHRVSVEEEGAGAGADCLSREGNMLVDSGLEDALGNVVSSLDDYRGQFPELQLLEQELKLLQVTLKVRENSARLITVRRNPSK